MELDEIYEKALESYTKTNFMNFNIKYVDLDIKLYNYLSFILNTLGASFLIFGIFDNNTFISNVGMIVNGIMFTLLGILFNNKYQKAFQNSFKKKHNIPKNKILKNTDYIFYDAFITLSKEKKFVKNIKYFLQISDIELHKKSFFENYFTVILITIFITIFGVLLSKIDDIEFLISLGLSTGIVIFLYNIYYSRSLHFGRNKHASFKLFLINSRHFIKKRS